MRLTAAVNLVWPASASPEQGAERRTPTRGLLLRPGSLALVLQIGNNPVQRAMSRGLAVRLEALVEDLVPTDPNLADR
jgi:hypothetical protein